MNQIEDALSTFNSGVYVVSAKRGQEINGLTCTWVMRVSLDPVLVAVSVGKTRYTYDLIKEGGAFAVSVLADGQEDIGRFFGSASGRDTDKFAFYPHEAKATGAPILSGCAAWLDCKLLHSYDAGDHTLFVGEVVDAGVSGSPALIFKSSDFA
ncbi:MAG: flavin reductase [Armatimonadetes bacterium]|nr:flavin reductase [Armatimonadota bacterium]